MTKLYAGIGSRRTPEVVLGLMGLIALRLGAEGWTLRSGGADGADLAFQHGAETGGHPATVYYASMPTRHAPPGPCTVQSYGPAAWTMDIAAAAHPAWDRCSDFVRALHSRNVHQVLGDMGPEHPEFRPSRFVVCWTPDGATTAADTSRDTGGTGQAIRIADRFGIEVFNLARGDHMKRLSAFSA